MQWAGPGFAGLTKNVGIQYDSEEHVDEYEACFNWSIGVQVPIAHCRQRRYAPVEAPNVSAHRNLHAQCCIPSAVLP